MHPPEDARRRGEQQRADQLLEVAAAIQERLHVARDTPADPKLRPHAAEEGLEERIGQRLASGPSPARRRRP